jgi:SOS response regulatory protein OraA/RecX
VGLKFSPGVPKQFTRRRTEGRKQGKFRVACDLRARGVPDQHIEAAIKESATETDESALVRLRIQGIRSAADWNAPMADFERFARK